jgi:hypothetical protein
MALEVYRYAVRRQPDAADDVVAEAFLAAWRRLDDIPAEAELAWLLGAAPEGREGLGFSMRDEHDPYRTTLIIDPDTSQLLSQSSVTLPGNPIPAGTVTSSSTYETPKVVEGSVSAATRLTDPHEFSGVTATLLRGW